MALALAQAPGAAYLFRADEMVHFVVVVDTHSQYLDAVCCSG
jgi:hypothetical protein